MVVAIGLAVSLAKPVEAGEFNCCCLTDSVQLGLGVEVSISTQDLHTRGCMGLRELTTYKWVIQGDYNVRL